MERFSRGGRAKTQKGTLECRQQRFDTSRELVFRRDQADNEIAVAGKIVEVPGMNVNALRGEQLNHEIFVRARCGHAQHGVPAALQLKVEFLIRLVNSLA